MGTRADFYLRDEWLGSVAMDGYEWADDPECALMRAGDDDAFLAAVRAIMDSRDDATVPAQGWPWPWDDSRTTDFAYRFEDDRVRVYCFGHPYDDQDAPKRPDWPNMSGVQKVTFGPRSGLIIMSGP